MFRCLVAVLPLFFVYAAAAQPLYLNEWMASNTATIADDFGDFDDWVEIYNAGASSVNIGGMHLSDDPAQPTKWLVPTDFAQATTIPAGGYILLWLDAEPTEGTLHGTFKLSSGGEFLGLFAADGMTVVDSVTFGPIGTDASMGRVPDGGSTFQVFNPASPNASNAGNLQQVAKPTALTAPGNYAAGTLELGFACATPGALVRYTTDGSEPTETSALLSGNLTSDTSIAVLLRAFKTGMSPSEVAFFQYVVGASHTFPVLALAIEPDLLFDPITGIYSTETDVEVPAYVSFSEPNGFLAFSKAATVEKQGTGSMALPQKSLLIKANAGDFDYPIFSEEGFGSYQSFIARNSGQDWNTTMFRDAFVSDLVRNTDDVDYLVRRPHIHTQDYRPGVLYLNGRYWGIHNVRERANHQYAMSHDMLNDDELDFMDNLIPTRGTDAAWLRILGYLDTAQMQQEEAYTFLKNNFDLSEWIDYNIFEIVVDNYDWPANNNRRWRAKAGSDTLWHWLAFDFDLSLGILTENEIWNSGTPYENSLARALEVNDNATYPNPEWATRPLRKSMMNPKFRTRFINRMADMLNTHFASERMLSRIDSFQTLYEPEIGPHLDFWAEGFNIWDQNVNKLRTFADARTDVVRGHVVDYFSEVTGLANVTLQVSPPNTGYISLSTITCPPGTTPWTGVYFAGMTIPISAHATLGYTFSHWESGQGNASDTSFTCLGDTTITAVFQLGSTDTACIAINEVVYHPSPTFDTGEWIELYNPTNETVNVSSWFVFDEQGNFFALPPNTYISAHGYLVIAEDTARFKSFYPNSIALFGNFDSGFWQLDLDNDSDEIRLFNAAGTRIDSLHYDDTAGWPTGADGTTHSLQRATQCIDTNSPTNWNAQLPTPGMPNIIDFTRCPLEGDQAYMMPNPAQHISYLAISSPASTDANIYLHNSVGVLVSKMSITLTDGPNWIPIDLTNLPSGVYSVSVAADDRRLQTTRLVIGN